MVMNSAGTAPSHACIVPAMPTFVFRLTAPRPTFALDMTDEEREIMGRHAAHWRPLVDNGQMVVFGPVLDGTDSGVSVWSRPTTKRS